MQTGQMEWKSNEMSLAVIVLYHILFWGSSDQDMLDEMAAKYKGKVIVGKCGEFLDRLTWFENMGTTGGQVLLEHRGNLGTIKLAGHTISPAIVDWDRNFIPDLLAGAEDGHFYYLKNKHRKKK